MAGNAEVKVAIVGDDSDLQRSLSGSQSKLSSFGKTIGKVALAAGAAAAVGLAALGKASVDAASDAQQSLGATETVFGRFAGNVIRTSNQAANAVGLSANAYREQANVLGSLLGNQGVAQDKLAGQTKSLIGVSADLAATFGGPTSDAVNALGAAFRGEFDTIERYGISIKQSTVNAEALKVAGVKTTAAFNDLSLAQQTAAKRQATTNLIMQQSAKSAGAFARESNTLAGQQQRLSAQWENLKVSLGNALLPAITNVFTALNQDLMPTLQKLADKYLPDVRRALNQWTKDLDVQRMIGDLVDTLEGIDWDSVSSGAADLGTNFRDLASGLKGVSVEGLNDGFSVFSTVVGFAADHVGLLAKAMPLLVGGFIALKTAQLVNQTVGRDSLIGYGLQLAATRQLTAANRELAVAMRGVGAVTTGAAGPLGTAGAAASTASTKFAKLGIAARGAAGLAGIGAIAGASATSNTAVSTLLTTLGGAATGFAVGGPIGAAVGGLAGLFASLAGNTEEAGESAATSKTSWDGLKDTLDSVTGATSESTRQFILSRLEQDGVLANLNEMGVSSRTAVNAILGQGGAQRELNLALEAGTQTIADNNAELGRLETRRAELSKVSAPDAAEYDPDAQDKIDAIDDRTNALEDENQALKDLIDSVREGTGATREDVRNKRQQIAATRDYAGQLKGLPRRARTRIEAEGIIPTTKAVARLANRYNLTPKQIKTLIKASGIDATVKDVGKVQKKMDDVRNTRGDIKRFRTDLTGDFRGMIPEVGNAAQKVGKGAKDGVKKGAQNPDLSGFRNDVRRGVDGAKSTAYTGGWGIGNSIKTGTLAGTSGLLSSLSGEVAAAVNAAIAAGRNAARAKSPSRRMEDLGRDLGRGLVRGVQKQHGNAHKAGKSLLEQLFKGAGAAGGSGSIEKALGRIDKLIEKRTKNTKEGEKRQKAILKHLADEFKALKKNGAEQDKNNAKIAAARARLKAVRDTMRDYARAVRDSFAAFGEVTQLGALEDGTVSLSLLLDQLQGRVVAGQRFAELIKSLQGQGLSRAVIEQLTAAGPEAGLATAEAIATGGQAAIDQINTLTGQLVTSGQKLGDKLAKEYYEEGRRSALHLAQGLVAGLVADQRHLDEVARRLARNLTQAVRNQLGIHSPSTVFAKLGEQVSQGLVIGIDETHAARAGARLADSLTSGFGQPGVSSSVAVAGGSGRFTVEVRLTAQQVSQLERGRAIQLDLDAYRGAGGRARS